MSASEIAAKKKKGYIITGCVVGVFVLVGIAFAIWGTIHLEHNKKKAAEQKAKNIAFMKQLYASCKARGTGPSEPLSCHFTSGELNELNPDEITGESYTDPSAINWNV